MIKTKQLLILHKILSYLRRGCLMVFKATFNNISVILKRFMKSINCSTPGHRSITYSKTSNIPYNLIFTTKFYDSLILITIISCDYLNLSLANEYVGDVTIPTQVIKYNQFFSRRISQSDCSICIKLNYNTLSK